MFDNEYADTCEYDHYEDDFFMCGDSCLVRYYSSDSDDSVVGSTSLESVASQAPQGDSGHGHIRMQSHTSKRW